MFEGFAMQPFGAGLLQLQQAPGLNARITTLRSICDFEAPFTFSFNLVFR